MKTAEEILRKWELRNGKDEHSLPANVFHMHRNAVLELIQMAQAEQKERCVDILLEENRKANISNSQFIVLSEAIREQE